MSAWQDGVKAVPVAHLVSQPGRSLSAISRMATRALYDELALYPKPGLVSLVDSGSHDDMDARTFWRSLFALRGWFRQATLLGAQAASFERLEAAGRNAEVAMLRATGGVNTHRGAIFCLGLLCASAGSLVASGSPLQDNALRHRLQALWGSALQARAAHVLAADVALGRALSHGAQAVRRHGLRGANDEAAAGMPMLFDVAVPALRQALGRGASPWRARLDTLLHVMASLDDTNLVHRGGLAALRTAQALAREALQQIAQLPDAQAHAVVERLHRRFVAARWSPGGAADVLAAACWVVSVTDPGQLRP